MSGIGQRVSGTFRRSRRNRGNSSQQPSEHEESSMHEEEEEVEALVGHAVDEAEAPFLDMESDREVQAYNLLKNRIFLHTPAFDLNILQKIGMDAAFTKIWKAIGWEKVAPVHELGSCLLTIQILCSMKILDNGIAFRCFGKEYFLYWKDLATQLGFHERCSIDLKFSLSGYNRHAFWQLISSQNVIGKFQPNNMNIHHPTLRFMQRRIAMVIFARDDTHHIHDMELKLLYAILKKIKVAPV